MRILITVLFSVMLTGVMPSRAQTASPIAAGGVGQKLDVYVSESKIIYLTKPVEDVTSSSPDIILVEKIRGIENQISVTGVTVGDATITVKMADATRVYQVKVSPMPQRVYINIPESKYLSFKNRVEDFNLSVPNVVRVLQPTDKELLLEALPRSSAGSRTTLTVYSNGEIFRYYVSTFENRGADLMEIQNAFAARGYKNLVVKFENDQLTIGGTVSTQEELDDAVRIAKQFTPYVIIRAVVGAYAAQADETEEERVIANNIHRIAQVKGLVIRVKFAQEEETITNTFTRVVGQPALTTSVTDNQTRLTTTSTQLPDTTSSGPINRTPVEGTIETVERRKNNRIPEKIFLFGNLEDDLDEARAMRVARTFCPLVVSMVTVKDPIQVRLKTRILTVDMNKLIRAGVKWTASDGVSPPNVSGSINYAKNFLNQGAPFALNQLILSLQTDINYTLELGETDDFIRQIQSIDLMLTNGQPCSIFRGQRIPYAASRTIDESGAISTSADFVSTGLSAFIVPLNYERSSQVPGEYLGLEDSEGQLLVPSLAKYFQMGESVGDQGRVPRIDESTKYVDENGLIGMCVFVRVSALEQFITISTGVQAPQTANKSSIARAHMREGQSIVIGGILDDQLRKTITSVPGFNKIPIFGFLFDHKRTNGNGAEMVMTFTPEVVRMKGADENRRLPRPNMPEMQDIMQQQKLTTSMKPVRYDARGIDLRPDMMMLPPSVEGKEMEPDVKVLEKKEEKETSIEVIPLETKTTVQMPESAKAPDIAQPPITDTGDVPPPPPAPAPPQPNVDTAAPRVNNPEPNPNEPPSTLP